MAKRQFQLTEKESNQIRQAEMESQDVRERQRLQAVRLYGSDMVTADIENALNCTQRSIQRWVNDYREEGVRGLKSGWAGQNAAKLSRQQRTDLKQRLHQYTPDQVIAPHVRISQGIFWTVSDLQIVVEQWYEVKYKSTDSYQTLLHECGFSYQRTEKVYRSRSNSQVILALDEMSLYFQATLTRVWAPIGRTPVVEVHPQRDCIYFYGALNVCNGREIAMRADAENSEFSCNFIMQLLMLYPQPILLLLDRASWHYGEVRVLIEHTERLQAIYFPVACPDLNPQEHVWERARDAISHNHTYRQFDALIEDFECYLNQTPFQTNFLDKYVPMSWRHF